MITTITINTIIVTTTNTIIIVIARQVWQAQNPPALAPPPRAEHPLLRSWGPARGRGHRVRNHLLLYFHQFHHPQNVKHHGEILFFKSNFIFLIATTRTTTPKILGPSARGRGVAARATTTFVFIFYFIFIITTTAPW